MKYKGLSLPQARRRIPSNSGISIINIYSDKESKEKPDTENFSITGQYVFLATNIIISFIVFLVIVLQITLSSR